MNIEKIIDKLQQRWRYRSYPQSHDIDQVAYRLAAEDSARYVIANMKTTPNYDWDLDLHADMCRLISTAQTPGHILEFGVASGRTIRNFARHLPGRVIHGFDSFQGLPETWSWLFPRGAFAQRQPSVPKSVQLHSGWFDASLPVWLDQNPGSIALLHIDCDLYSSTRTILELCYSRLVVNTVIIFDEYLNHLGWEHDEFRAWQEFVAETGIKYEYIGRVGSHQQVAIRITDIGVQHGQNS